MKAMGDPFARREQENRRTGEQETAGEQFCGKIAPRPFRQNCLFLLLYCLPLTALFAFGESGRQDLNLRPPAPKAGALPS